MPNFVDERDRILAALEDPRPLSESLPAYGLGHLLERREPQRPARHLRLVESHEDDDA